MFLMYKYCYKSILRNYIENIPDYPRYHKPPSEKCAQRAEKS